MPISNVKFDIHKVANFIRKRKLYYGKKLWFFKLNTEISLTTQDSQGVYVFDVLMAFFNYLFTVVSACDT